jgi:mRNA interferase MazF
LNQGEIWSIDFDPTRGAEMQKLRPAVIVSVDTAGKLPLRVVVPITNLQPVFQTVPWMVTIASSAQTHLIKDSTADCFQVRSVSTDRFNKLIGKVSQAELDAINTALKSVFGMS